MPYYKPNKKLLRNGQITVREDHFQEMGYEYTLYLNDHEELVSAFEQFAASSRWCRIKRFDKTHGFVCCIGTDSHFEVGRVTHKDIEFSDGSVRQAVSYAAYFQDWYTFGPYPGMGDEMNQLLTLLELTFVRIDPLTWVRQVPVKARLMNEIGSTRMNWEADPPNRKLTREEAASKNLSEYYLADKLNQTGISVYGGSPLAQAQNILPNPLIEERVQRNLELAEKIKNEEPPKRFCSSCGAEIMPGTKFCSSCGAEIIKTYKEKMDEEPGIRRYPPMFITEVGDNRDPFIFACIDENKNIIPEPQDHLLQELPLAALYIDYKPKNRESYQRIFTSQVNHDNYMYISDSRVAFINRKYNKDEAGSWVGFGGASAFVISEILTYSGKAIKAAQRRDKAFAGHIRYEWMGLIAYRHKNGMLENDDLRFVYIDQEKTKWLLRVELRKGYDSEIIANDIVRRIASYRQTLKKDRTDEELQFIQRYTGGNAVIPKETEPGAVSTEVLPGNCFASKGSFMRA